MADLNTKQDDLGLQLSETKQLLHTVENKMRMSRRKQKLLSDASDNDSVYDDDNVDNVLIMTRVKGQPLVRYNRVPAKHKVNTTKILNANFLKQPPEPSVVPRRSDVMRIRNDETLRNVGRLPVHEMMLHSPTAMAEKLKADKIYEEQARSKADRIVFVSGSGYVHKSLPPKCE